MRVLLEPTSMLPGDAPIVVDQNVFEIGRAPGCNLRVNSPWVSRRHCRLVVADGKVVLEDLGSRNGTYVNHQPTEAARALTDGDIVGFGLSEYRVSFDAPTVDARRSGKTLRWLLRPITELASPSQPT